MSNRRTLKKTIHLLCDELFFECCLIKFFSEKDNTEKAEVILTKIVDTEAEYVKRAGRYDGKENPSVVRKYYSKLKDDFSNTWANIFEEIQALNK